MIIDDLIKQIKECNDCLQDIDREIKWLEERNFKSQYTLEQINKMYDIGINICKRKEKLMKQIQDRISSQEEVK